MGSDPAGLSRSPSPPGARSACAAAPRVSPAAGSTCGRATCGDCWPSTEIGRWTVKMLALHGQGRMEVVPAGDLG
jgi:hypothetical protein